MALGVDSSRPREYHDIQHLRLFGDRDALTAYTERNDFVHCAFFLSGLCGHPAEWSTDPLDVRWADPFDPRRHGLCFDCWRRRVDLRDQGRIEEEDPGEVDISPFWIARHKHLKNARRALPDASAIAEITGFLGGLRKGLRLLAYGDSISAGYCPLTAMVGTNPLRAGAPYAQSLQERLTEVLGCDVEVLSCGAVGLSTKQLVERADRERFIDCANREVMGLRAMLEHCGPFDAVLILSGAQDLSEGTQAPEVVRRLHKLHEICFDYRTLTIALGIPVDHRAATLHNFATRHSRVNLLMRDWAADEYNRQWTTYVDTAALLPYWNAPVEPGVLGYWQPDGLHFTATGAHQIGRQIADAIEPFARKHWGWRLFATGASGGKNAKGGGAHLVRESFRDLSSSDESSSVDDSGTARSSAAEGSLQAEGGRHSGTEAPPSDGEHPIFAAERGRHSATDAPPSDVEQPIFAATQLEESDA